MTTKYMKIGIIGAGNMGAAVYKALAANKYNVNIIDSTPSKAGAVSGKTPLTLPSLCSKSDYLIVAVKPQSFETLAPELKKYCKNKVIVSIMAGVTIKKISALLNNKKIIRVMPNLPIKVGYGLAGWIASKNITSSERKVVSAMLHLFGISIELRDETKINAITALSGCGPAYFYYFTEALEAAAKKFGFNAKVSRLIAETTFVGAAKLLHENNLSAKEWREAVASKKGTTEAALKIFSRKNLSKIIMSGILAANRRAVELSK